MGLVSSKADLRKTATEHFIHGTWSPLPSFLNLGFMPFALIPIKQNEGIDWIVLGQLFQAEKAPPILPRTAVSFGTGGAHHTVALKYWYETLSPIYCTLNLQYTLKLRMAGLMTTFAFSRERKKDSWTYFCHAGHYTSVGHKELTFMNFLCLGPSWAWATNLKASRIQLATYTFPKWSLDRQMILIALIVCAPYKPKVESIVFEHNGNILSFIYVLDNGHIMLL